MVKSRSGQHAGRLATPTVAALSDLDRMWASVDQARAKMYRSEVHAVRPENCFTVEEYAERYGMSRTGAQNALERLEIRNDITRVRFRTLGADGRLIAKVGWTPVK